MSLTVIMPMGSARAQEGSVVDRLKGFAAPQEHPVTATLIAEHTSLQPRGQTRIGVLFQMEEGWHIYAQDPGEAGLPTTVVWSVPDDVVLGPLTWPQHQAFLDPGNIRTFGYNDRVVLESTLHLTHATAPGTLPIQARVEWLACEEICIPGSAALTLELPVTSQPPEFSPHAELFQQPADQST